MRASDLEGKEVIEISSGERLGKVRDWELLIDLERGMVAALLLSGNGRGKEKENSIPWEQVRKISAEFILVEGGLNS